MLKIKEKKSGDLIFSRDATNKKNKKTTKFHNKVGMIFSAPRREFTWRHLLSYECRQNRDGVMYCDQKIHSGETRELMVTSPELSLVII